MAVAYRSVTVGSFGGISAGANLSLTKPTGLAVGDYLVAHLVMVNNSTTVNGWNTPSGWTSLIDATKTANANSGIKMQVFYKVADSGDVAGGSFEFQKDATGATAVGGALYAISGGATIVGAVGTDTDDTSPEFVNTVTPSANSILLFLTGCADAGQSAGTVSGYAITTSNPTWTESYDFKADISSDRGVMAGAYASRPEATATGDSTCNYSAHGQNSIGAMIAIAPVISVTVNSDTLSATFSLESVTVTGGATVSPDAVVSTFSIPTPTVSSPDPKWVNQTKSASATFTNLTKSS